MSDPIGCGIDFGTTNSSIALAYSDRVEMIEPSPTRFAPLLPSIIYLHRNRNRAAGENAISQYLVTGSRSTRCGGCEFSPLNGPSNECRHYRAGSRCHDARIMSELKTELPEPLFRKTHSWGEDFEPEELASIVLGELKAAAERTAGARVRRAVIGFPVLFAGAEGDEYETRQELALQRLVEAARRSGFEEVEFLEEPAAAAIGEEELEGLLVVTDFGGGTFDVAVMDVGGDRGEVLALQGAAIGGELFSSRLFKEKVAAKLNLDGENGDPFRGRLSSLAGVMGLLSDPTIPGIIRSGRGRYDLIDKIVFGGHAYGFYRAIDQAKVDLSTSTHASISFKRPGIKIDIPVERTEFDRLIREDLNIVEAKIREALDDAGVRAAQVDAVIRTGGSSSIPAFVHRLESLFGSDKVHEREAFSTVVHGLASHARRVWSS